MSQARNYLAVDLGAESGRAILGSFADRKLTLSEMHRFANQPVLLNDGLHWDVLELWRKIQEGIALSARDHELTSIGLDTWGVDFALLDKNNSLLFNPFHYRDARTDGMMDEAFKVMPRAEIFANSGIQFMQLNTLYQLLATERSNPSLFDIARAFLTIPDLFNFWLTGELTNEFTNATTTQFYAPRARDWSMKILTAFNIPTHLFKPTTDPGTVIGKLSSSVSARESAKESVYVILPACHDTGSAVVAVPAKNEDFAWLSSGTWSIMGAEVREPCLNEKALEYNFTNEGGVFGTWRLSKNIMGLWLVQECRREWMRQGEELSFDALTQLAAESEAFLPVIDPDFDEFLHPGDMPSRIQKFCADTNQNVPQTKGQIIRVALESIALKYRFVLERLEELSGKRLDPLHIIGGGTQNRLLNQFTADATKRTVVTGPVEATAIGNVLMQAIGLKHLGSLSDAREVVRASFDVEEYHPESSDGWDEAYAKLLHLMDREN